MDFRNLSMDVEYTSPLKRKRDAAFTQSNARISAPLTDISNKIAKASYEMTPRSLSKETASSFNLSIYNFDNLNSDVKNLMALNLDLQNLTSLAYTSKKMYHVAVKALIILTNAGMVNWPLAGFCNFSNIHNQFLYNIDFSKFTETSLFSSKQEEYNFALSKCSNLKSLSIPYLNIRPESIDVICQNPLLESLSIGKIYDLSLSCENINTIVTALPKLKSITISDCYLVEGECTFNILMVLDQFPNIRNIRLEKPFFLSIEKFVPKQKEDANLVDLEITADDYDPEALDALRKVYNVSIVKSVAEAEPTYAPKIKSSKHFPQIARLPCALYPERPQLPWR